MHKLSIQHKVFNEYESAISDSETSKNNNPSKPIMDIWEKLHREIQKIFYEFFKFRTKLDDPIYTKIFYLILIVERDLADLPWSPLIVIERKVYFRSSPLFSITVLAMSVHMMFLNISQIQLFVKVLCSIAGMTLKWVWDTLSSYSCVHFRRQIARAPSVLNTYTNLSLKGGAARYKRAFCSVFGPANPRAQSGNTF